MSTPSSTQNQPGEPASQTLDPPKVERGGLRCAVKSTDYQNFDRLADILGLSNKAIGIKSNTVVKAWMASDSFKPAYDELVRDWIVPLWDKAGDSLQRKPAPPLKRIVGAISKNPERYTSPTGVVDKTAFAALDHYALCLVRLRAANEFNANGLFRGKTCEQKQKDQRLWQAMMRGGTEAWRRRKRGDNLTEDEEMDD
ncbi:hypothetical protein V493_04875 [Pseudogymnoascus sp. VKM F-4281 (FW-2241)]|nr:hypothetical protein V493_04875 [Pseudogymnoascus sp. VKM F-4281 (FW-2241)]